MFQTNNVLKRTIERKLMKYFVFTVMALIFCAAFVLSATQEEKQMYKECNQNCSQTKISDQNSCREEFESCKLECSDSNCKFSCAMNKSACQKQTKLDYNLCRAECKQIIAPKCSFGENTYLSGEIFLDECNVCECKSNGQVTCKKEPFCNKTPETNQTKCEQAGGLYSALCKGSFFDIMCSQQKFCVCEGNNNYSCPSQEECLKQFDVKIRRSGLPQLRDMLGTPLGDIGICVSN